MSTPDPERAIEKGADELEERIGKLDDSIDDAKKKQVERQAHDEGPLGEGDDDEPTTAPAKGGPMGDDASGFDDPEAEEEEEDE